MVSEKHYFNCFQNSIKGRHNSESQNQMDMTIVLPARVQNGTTSAPKLDQPLSRMTMGCWDAITIKASPPFPSKLPPYNEQHPWPAYASPKILTFFLFYHFLQIVPLCPALLERHRARSAEFKDIWWNSTVNPNGWWSEHFLLGAVSETVSFNLLQANLRPMEDITVKMPGLL